MKSPLVLSRLTKRYGEKTILEPLDLKIVPGEFVTLLGPSGCGKTTLLRMIAGLEQPSGGEIRMGDRVLEGAGRRLPPEDRGFGMVFQSYAVWPHMNVWQNVQYPLKVNPKWKSLTTQERDEKTKQAIQWVHLEGLETRWPQQLSGGQQQRVALARGLVMEPDVLLLDEPLSNLDAKLRAEMRREIRDLHRRIGLTLVYVTHDQKEAFEMSTRVIVLHAGHVAQDGTPEEVRNHPKPGFVQEFLAEMG
jgi:iron(III) transport system ATP-binding protein